MARLIRIYSMSLKSSLNAKTFSELADDANNEATHLDDKTITGGGLSASICV